MKKKVWLFWCWVIPLAVLSTVYAEEPRISLPLEYAAISSQLRGETIVVVQFLPLPYKTHPNDMRHERIFTDEFFSPKPTDAEINGFFIPENYLQLINSAIRSAAEMIGLALEIVPRVSKITGSPPDFIILGVVKALRASTKTDVEFDIQIIEGKNLTLLAETTISNTLEMSEIPFWINLPVHMIGQHANDFHPQRTLIHHVIYRNVMDMFTFLGEKIQSHEIN